MEGQGSAGMMQIVMIVVLIAIFYFFMIRPQQKRQKEIKKFRDGISEGDKVITSGGVYGTVRKVKETTFVIEVDKNVCLTVDRNSVYPSAPTSADLASDQKS